MHGPPRPLLFAKMFPPLPTVVLAGPNLWSGGPFLAAKSSLALVKYTQAMFMGNKQKGHNYTVLPLAIIAN